MPRPCFLSAASLCCVLSWLLLLLFAQVPWQALAASKDIVCEPITVPMCKGIGYNLTYMPNQFNHDTQEEVGLEVHQFWPLVRIRCSPDMLFFLCSMYTPICLPDYKKPLPPCRSVCERAKRGCSPLMSQYGFEWPERMNCEQLPMLGDTERLCMDQNSSESTTLSPLFQKPTPKGLPRRRPPASQECDRECRCREPLVPIRPEARLLYNRVRIGPLANCALPCHQPYFSQDERAFTTFWIGLWSVLCFISTLTTVATFLIDMERFKYPERPIIFLATCYLFVSLGYIVRLVAGHERVACGAEHQHILYDTTGPALCTLVFLLVYFFGMASSIWWVVLSFTWFLAAGMKWGNEAIASYSQYFHLAAWLVPSVKSIAVLALSSVDGDPVAGICYVGNQNLDNLRGFVLAPLVVYLFTGSLFLLAGFVSLFRIRSVIKQGGTKTDKLEKLMIRIGLFTVLYTVPATIVVACLVYEQHYRPAWERALGCSCAAERQRHGPDYAVFMLKYLMCLVVGITSGVWIWSGKTLESWRKFTAHCHPCRSRKTTGASMYSEASAALTARAGSAGLGAYHKPTPLSHV
ncbi:frizzled-5 [Paramormyrops kingsleyae]|uniref:Frizzled-5 n=1 Tax=Paramormyrops kingsleyae TaxID=1676925 RepID=A0A3B3T064_9TELE|nr:frizzled-5 [Paramormyrops kingsleyae]XP_023682429.1 frizzled-5 [Paramormyrops kingsleyae]